MPNDTHRRVDSAKPTPERKGNRLTWLRHTVDDGIKSALLSFQRNVIRRLPHLSSVRRPIVGWLIVVLCLLIGSLSQPMLYSSSISARANAIGGTYAEGTLDKITTISPLAAATDTEKAASALSYPGLLSYDTSGKLQPVLAESWHVDASGEAWTVQLRDNVSWSDGTKLSAADVVFTANLVKSSRANSNLRNVSVSKVDDKTVLFTLEAPYASFDTALTFGILPEHAFRNDSAASITATLSKYTKDIPVSGPFMLSQVSNDNSTWGFVANDHYYGDTPRLKAITLQSFGSAKEMIAAFNSGTINAVGNLRLNELKSLRKDSYVVQNTTADGVFLLFNTDGSTTGDNVVRSGLRLAINRPEIRRKLVADSATKAPRALETPIASGIYDEVDSLHQPNYNRDAALETLAGAGWANSDGKLVKNGEQMTLSLVTIKGTNYENLVNLIADDWRAIGVKVDVHLADPASAQQAYLLPHNYDALVYQLHLGSDPDVYSYWAGGSDNTANLSGYSSRRASIALSNGRTSIDDSIRAARYASFVREWQQDCPGIAFYQPSYYSAYHSGVNALQPTEELVDASHRYDSVTSWTADTDIVNTTP